MATVVDICNLALSRLGDRATVSSIDPPEGSAQADHCARFYPLARDTALEEASWTFATRREALTLSAHTAEGWQFCYYVPNGCLHLQKLVRPEIAPTAGAIYSEDETLLLGLQDNPFITETDITGREVICTNVEDAQALFTYRVTDPSKFSSRFIDALVFLLASYLAGPVLKGRTGEQAAQRMYAAYVQQIGGAAARNANQQNHKREYTPNAMRARGIHFARRRTAGI